MTVLRYARIAFAMASAAAVVACVARTVEMAPRYSAHPQTSGVSPETPASGSCLVHVAGIHDLRTDPHSLGGVKGQMVHVEDSAEWIRSGIDSIADGSTIRLSDDGTVLSLDVDLLKAYLMTVTSETSSANVVLRIRYSIAGRPLD